MLITNAAVSSFARCLIITLIVAQEDCFPDNPCLYGGVCNELAYEVSTRGYSCNCKYVCISLALAGDAKVKASTEHTGQ